MGALDWSIVKEGCNSRAAVISELKLNGTAVFFVNEGPKKKKTFSLRGAGKGTKIAGILDSLATRQETHKDDERTQLHAVRRPTAEKMMRSPRHSRGRKKKKVVILLTSRVGRDGTVPWEMLLQFDQERRRACRPGRSRLRLRLLQGRRAASARLAQQLMHRQARSTD